MTALLVIDLQKAFEEIEASGAERNNPHAMDNVAALLAAFRAAGEPVIHVRHSSVEDDSPFRPDRSGFAVMDAARERDGEPVLLKEVNSAFIGTELESLLRSAGVARLVIVGATTNHCVETTARMAGNLGFDTRLVDDATWTFSRVSPSGRRWSAHDLHDATLTNLSEEFATIVRTEDVLRELRGALDGRPAGAATRLVDEA